MYSAFPFNNTSAVPLPLSIINSLPHRKHNLAIITFIYNASMVYVSFTVCFVVFATWWVNLLTRMGVCNNIEYFSVLEVKRGHYCILIIRTCPPNVRTRRSYFRHVKNRVQKAGNCLPPCCTILYTLMTLDQFSIFCQYIKAYLCIIRSKIIIMSSRS